MISLILKFILIQNIQAIRFDKHKIKYRLHRYLIPTIARDLWA